MTFIARGSAVAAAAVVTLAGTVVAFAGTGAAWAVPAGSPNGKLLRPSALGIGWHVISASPAPGVGSLSACGNTIDVISPTTGAARVFTQLNKQAASFVTEGISVLPSSRDAASVAGAVSVFLANCTTVTQTVDGKLKTTTYHSLKSGITGGVGYTVLTSSGSKHTAIAVIVAHKGNESVTLGATVRLRKGADTDVTASVALARREVKLALAKA